MRRLLILWLLTTLSLANALDHLQHVPMRILRWQTKNIITIDRGAEDGLVKNDHVKIISDEYGFVTRGVVVKTRLKTAYIRVYRRYHIQNLKRGKKYKLLSIRMSHLPEDIKEVADNIMITLPKSQDPDNVDIQAELTEWVPGDRFIKDKKTSIRTLNKKQLKRDFRDTVLTAQVSPLSYGRLRRNKDMGYLIGLKNGDEGKFHGNLNYRYDAQSMTDPYTLNETRYSAHQAQGDFGVNRIYKDWSYFMRATFERERMGGIQPINYRLGLAPLSARVHHDGLWGIKKLRVAFGPLMHFQSLQGFDSRGDIITVADRRLRLLVEIDLEQQIREHIIVTNTFKWKPSWGFPISTDFEDGILTNLFGIHFQQSIFSFTYENLINWDSQRKSISGLPSTNLAHAFKFGLRYKF